MGLMIIGLMLAGCGSSETAEVEQVSCGEGTRLADGACIVAADPCDALSFRNTAGECVPLATQCAEGTIFDEGREQCIAEDTVRCGADTVLVEGVCVPDLDVCGADTAWDETLERCVSTAQPCGEGTSWDAGVEACLASAEVCGGFTEWSADLRRCVSSDAVCGTHTAWDEILGQCLAAEGVCGEHTIWDGDSRRCVISSDLCGPRTTWDAATGQCLVTDQVCGTHTVWDADAAQCLASSAGCGPNTTWDPVTLQCVPNAGVCGANTEWDADSERCLPTDGVCGANTVWEEATSRCVPTGAVCGAGTAYDDATGQCLPTSSVCGEGTAWDEDLARCLATSEVCGARTTWDVTTSRCVPTDEVCGANTRWDADLGQCVLVDVICGLRTVWDADLGQCVVDSDVCGFGASWDPVREVCVTNRDACGPNTYFDPRIEQCVVGHVLVGNCASPIVIGGNINETTTFARNSCFRVTTNLVVRNGAHLTIQDGVTMSFDAGVLFDVNNGTLAVEGTEASPVLMTGLMPEPGYWQGLRITNSDSDLNQLDHLILEYGGQTAWVSGNYAGFLVSPYLGTVRVGVRNSVFRHNRGPGVYVEPTFAGRLAHLSNFTSNTLVGNVGPGMIISAQRLGSLDGSSTFAGNGEAYVEVLGQTAVGDQTLSVLDVPYRLTGNVALSGGTFIIEAGARFEFESNVGFFAGGAAQTTVIARGTLDNPIVFTGAVATPGYWQGVRLSNSLDPNQILEHVIIEYAGSAGYDGNPQAGLTVASNGGAIRARLSNVTVRHNVGYGIYVATDFAGRLVTIDRFEDNVLTANSLGPISLLSTRLHLIDEGTDYSGNDVDFVDVRVANVSFDVVWPGVNVPYRFSAGFIVRDEATLTLSPGVEIEFPALAGVSIGTLLSPGYLVARGEADRPIILRGREALPGYWQGLRLTNTPSVTNVLEHVEIYHGGSAAWANSLVANLTLSDNNGPVNVRLRNVHLADGLGAGAFVSTNRVSIDECLSVTFEAVSPDVAGNTMNWYSSCF